MSELVELGDEDISNVVLRDWLMIFSMVVDLILHGLDHGRRGGIGRLDTVVDDLVARL